MCRSEFSIIDLEHDTDISPLGEYRDHCSRCRHVHDCGHDAVVVDEIRAFGRGLVHTVRYCERCGIDPEEDA